MASCPWLSNAKKQIVACAEWILHWSSGGKAQTLGGH
jgi:hypothetical protein